MWVKTLSRRITLLTEWMMHKGYDRVSERLGTEFFVRNHKSENTNGTTVIYWDDEENKEKAEIIAKECKKDRNFLRDVAKTCYGFCDSVISKSSEIASFDLSKDGNDTLLELFKEYVNKFNDLMVPVYIIFPMELYLTEEVLRELRDEFKDKSETEIKEYFRILTILSKMSDTFLEQKDLFEIATLFKNKSLQNSEVKERIRIHTEKFGWMGVSDNSLLENQWSEDYFIERLNAIENPEEKLKNLLSNRKKEIETYERFAKNVNNNVVDDAKVLQDFMYLRTYRITALKKAQINIKPLLREISKRFDISFEDIVWFKPEEIESLIKDGIVPDVEGRKIGYVVIRENGNVRLERKADNIEYVESTKVLKGMIANRGKATGLVKIIHNANESNKINKGEILVTKMTVPDMIMALDKCGAIVTDEGGVLCHAAIVSREMGKPCIVGTKVATKVLKDGYLVMVDAENGTVTIIESKK